MTLDELWDSLGCKGWREGKLRTLCRGHAGKPVPHVPDEIKQKPGRVKMGFQKIDVTDKKKKM